MFNTKQYFKFRNDLGFVRVQVAHENFIFGLDSVILVFQHIIMPKNALVSSKSQKELDA